MSKVVTGRAPVSLSTALASSLQQIGSPAELQLAEGLEEDAECIKQFKTACRAAEIETKISNFGALASTDDLVALLWANTRIVTISIVGLARSEPVYIHSGRCHRVGRGAQDHRTFPRRTNPAAASHIFQLLQPAE